MSQDENEDKPTVVIDLNALKKKKQQEIQALEEISDEIEFNAVSKPKKSAKFETVYLLDLFGTLFTKNLHLFPKKYEYKIISSLDELTRILKNKDQKIVLLDYDSNPKMINRISAQIKQKFSHIKTVFIAKNISAEKAKLHAQSSSGADCYFQLPFEAKKIESELSKLDPILKKTS